MNRQKLIEMHLIFGSFLIPVVTMFAITGALYSFKITGNYETKKSEIEIPQAVSPDLDQLVIIARKFISENSLAEPSGNYYSYKGRWDGIGKWVIYPRNDVKNRWEEE